MKCALLSDLHYEFHGSLAHVRIPPGVETLILAGDVSNASRLKPVLEHYAQVVENVVYVAGNHEHYGHGALDFLRRIRTPKNVHWLRAPHKILNLKGVTFAGDTLWFGDYDGLNQMYERAMPDFSAIRAPGNKPTASWIYERHAKAVNFFTSVQADVFVTHHLPTPVLTAPQYLGSPINRFFSSPVFERVSNPPAVWCYGHTHTANDRVLGDTRFLCNPRGYPDERPGVYEPMVFDVEAKLDAPA